MENKSRTNNKSKYNLYLEFKYKDIYIKTIFGNDFMKKNTYVNISQNFNTYEYSDKFSKITLNDQLKKTNFQKKSPLENSIFQFIKSLKEKNNKENLLLDSITYQLENIQYRLIK